MGQDKRFLLKDGQKWIDRSLGMLREFVTENYSVMLSGTIEGYDGIADISPGLGPLGGLYSVIRSLLEKGINDAWLLVMPVDMPLMEPHFLYDLVNQRRDDDETEILCFEGKVFPILLRASPSVVENIEELLQLSKKSRSFLNLIERSKTRLFPLIDDRCFVNCNTPSDLELI
ncbi:MAG: hypothetical protein RJB66_399 [Pseudomonadota bacterium]|jgi:molybdopterin-guanine dinucleotide biosynthesis protein A